MKPKTIDKSELKIIPRHIAIIMDGNGRWAKQRGLPRIAGHREGINSVREITKICGEIGVKYLTLYTFSTENWSRPKTEVKALMTLLLSTIKKEIKELHKNDVKFSTIGDISILPKGTVKGIKEGEKLTFDNSGLNLILALNYGSRQEIISAVNNIVLDIKKGSLESNSIDENIFSSYLYTNNCPDPDLLIRTSGELRISNFLLWQSAYTEMYLTNTYWPSFRENELFTAIVDFQNRERRFGKTSEQLEN
ncbi:isoprenyl transferase [Candidatus Marinimicrobia bacterium]|jgi:undecaprenyl diphosphate synthase|nr:isoprenyl transferase [Candidatus Neomarinimicrobiota bacterium]|tara:strand:- start:3316 stop:4065 length:750 start_codon:yes stop_codon:yes gene_type:complete